MQPLLYFLATAFTLCILSVVAYAQSSVFSERAKLACVEQTKERTAALVARDWPQLNRLAMRYIQLCRGAFDARDLSTAYVDIAIASLGMHRPKDALDAADSCVVTYYANPGCHLHKIQALLALDRLVEAKGLLHVAERLVTHARSENETDLRAARNSSERELYLARKNEYQAQLELLKTLRIYTFACFEGGGRGPTGLS